MSSKAFYQTLYQSEHLFRVPTETAADWGVIPAAPTEPVAVAVAPAVPVVRPPEVSVVPPTVDVQEVLEQVQDKPTPPLVASVEEADAEQAVETLISETLSAPVLIQDTQPPARSVELPKPALLKHKVLLLADEDLSPSDLLFLEKILKAVNLDVSGVDLLNLYGVSDIDFASVLRNKYINHFITFGVPFRRINLDILMDRYQPIRFDGITFLMVDSLPVIEANQTLKRQLWNSLKRVFEL